MHGIGAKALPVRRRSTHASGLQQTIREIKALLPRFGHSRFLSKGFTRDLPECVRTVGGQTMRKPLDGKSRMPFSATLGALISLPVCCKPLTLARVSHRQSLCANVVLHRATWRPRVQEKLLTAECRECFAPLRPASHPLPCGFQVQRAPFCLLTTAHVRQKARDFVCCRHRAGTPDRADKYVLAVPWGALSLCALQPCLPPSPQRRQSPTHATLRG